MLALASKDNLEKALLKALFLHVFILALIYALSHFIDLGELKPITTQDIEVINSAVRIDIVSMPKLTIKELKKVDLSQTIVTPEKEVKEEKAANETSEIEFKKKAKKIDVNNLLKDFSKKNVIKKLKKTDTKKPIIDNSELQKIILEGNKVSQGSSTTGDSIDQANQAYVRYVQKLPDRVKPHWKLPSYLLDRNLRCRVRIFLDRNGKILKSQVIESSGEEEFDAKALEAVKQSSPLPAPEKEFLGRAIGGDIILGFPL